MFDTLLIANRGEIACRIIRSAKRLGVRTVAVYSEVDAGALHVEMADDAVLIGPALASDSYLNIDRLLAAARRAGAQAVHPGYGFLSENSAFADAVTASGLVFVGPSAEVIETMGSKIAAKNTVAAAGTPVVPGYRGDDQSSERLLAEAQAMGFPLLIKASAGGGGKGMRIVTAESEFETALAAAQREAKAAFADDQVLLERYLTEPKHLEVQILADQHGNTLHLFERDCSLQRRHQKVVEEAPGPRVGDKLRSRLGEAAVLAARAVDYTGAGTVEFIAEGDNFYFMEMNTRLQVEHPVTEAITGLDLVAWQLRIAAGEALPYRQEQMRQVGHAIEVRLYAENPQRKFLPSSGTLTHVALPDSVRVDAGIRSGDQVTPHYDPMLGKLIAHGKDRESARRQLHAALSRTQLVGVAHNVDYLRAVLASSAFVAGDYTTSTLEQQHEQLAAPPLQKELDVALIIAALADAGAQVGGDVWHNASGFRLNQPAHQVGGWVVGKARSTVRRQGDCFQVDGRSYSLSELQINSADAAASNSPLQISVLLDDRLVRAEALLVNDDWYVLRDGATTLVQRYRAVLDDQASGLGNEVIAPMPGQVIALLVGTGDQVHVGDAVVVMEAMKMEHTLTAPCSGMVASIHIGVGDKVLDGQGLVAVEPAATSESSSPGEN
ncbi:MAG: acetyl/propionyl/methylcrotonyl-CoA carboxylase subunit alpha [Pseudomonadales bacterium]